MRWRELDVEASIVKFLIALKHLKEFWSLRPIWKDNWNSKNEMIRFAFEKTVHKLHGGQQVQDGKIRMWRDFWAGVL